MPEPLAVRWSRRAKTVPVMLLATALGVLGFPLLASLAVVSDMIRGRLRLPTLRVYLFLLQYAVNDSVEIVLAPIYWAMAGFGATAGSKASIARHQRLQWWSAQSLETRARQLLGLRVELDESSREALAPGPVIVISRHSSLLDASLPGLIYHREGFSVRAVIMAELLADPGFDLIYGRTGSVFVPRDRGSEAVAAIRAMTASIDSDSAGSTALIIFPEGRLFNPAVRDRLLARLIDSDSDSASDAESQSAAQAQSDKGSQSVTGRGQRLAALTNLLPPRPGGLLALLAELPEADVVLLDHRGLERFSSVGQLLSAVPAEGPIQVTAKRIPRSQIPADRDRQVEWLDQLWLNLDAELTVQTEYLSKRYLNKR